MVSRNGSGDSEYDRNQSSSLVLCSSMGSFHQLVQVVSLEYGYVDDKLYEDLCDKDHLSDMKHEFEKFLERYLVDSQELNDFVSVLSSTSREVVPVARCSPTSHRVHTTYYSYSILVTTFQCCVPSEREPVRVLSTP